MRRAASAPGTSVRIEVEREEGAPILLEDGRLAEHERRLAALGPAPPARLCYAAAHVAWLDGYRELRHTPQAPGSPAELAPWIDWEATRAARARLAASGFAIAEAMDTAQRFELGWENARRLVEECALLRPVYGFAAGAAADHLEEIAGEDALVEGVIAQARFIQGLGGEVVLLPLAWLARRGYDEAGYVRVYRRIVEALDGPLLVHWLGPMFAPELEGYFPGESFRRVLALDPSKVRGAKLSLLDDALELRLRRELLERDQVLLTGDDLHFAALIFGGDPGAPRAQAPPILRTTRIGAREVPLGDFSHALLGVLDAVHRPAGLALALLAHGDARSYLELMGPCEELGRLLFEPPTQHYKAGLAFLAWLEGAQPNAMLANHVERARGREHLLELARRASRAGVLSDAQAAAARLAELLHAGP